MTIEEFCEDYFAYNRISENRRKFVRRVLGEFETFVGGSIEQATPEHFRDWMLSLVDAGYHVNTVRKRGRAVRCYFNHAWHRRAIDADTLLRIKAVKDPRGASDQAKPRPYTRHDLDRFRAEIDARWPYAHPLALARFQAGDARYPRVYKHAMRLQLEAIASLALDCGLRASEIWHGSIEDIHPDNACVVVRMGKSRISDEPRVREVPHTVHSRTAVAKWLEFREILNPPHDQPWLVLAPNASPNNPNASAVLAPMRQNRMRGLLSTVGPGWELHRMRHTCATMWLRADVPLEKVSRLLGHSTITQTLCYAELVSSDIETAMQMNETKFNRLLGRRKAA